MNDVIKIEIENIDPAPKKKSVKAIREFLDLYGEVKDHRLFLDNGLLVLGFDHNGEYMEVEFGPKGCVILCSFEDVPTLTPAELVNKLVGRAKTFEGMQTFEIGTIMDSMDLWEKQVRLGEKAFALIEQHRLADQIPEFAKLSKKWNKIQKKFA